MRHSARALAGVLLLLAGVLAAPRAGLACFPVSDQDKLVASDAEINDEFGRAVCVKGDLALVGAYGDDDFGEDSGAAYLFEAGPAGEWSQVAKLTAEDAGTWQRFGGAVSLSGRRALIGRAGFGPGKAYLFEPDSGDAWVQVAELVPALVDPPIGFGGSVSLAGDLALVGSSGDDLAGPSSGSAWLFRREADGTWSQLAMLTAADAAADQFFGSSVSLDEGRAVVGAPGDAHAGPRSGAAYVFEEDRDGAWPQVAKLTADDAGARAWFGASVSVSGDRLVVGSYGDDDPTGPTTGSAYVFERDDLGAWSQAAKLSPDDAAAGDQFGYSTAVSGDRAVIGSLGNDDAGRDSGSAYLFERDEAGAWSQAAKLTAADAAMDDGFGIAVSIDGSRTLVGSAGDDDAGSASGSAHLIEQHCWIYLRRNTEPVPLFIVDRVEGSTWTDTEAVEPLLFYRVFQAVDPDLRVTRVPEGLLLSW